MSNNKGKVAIVTGAAKNIGRATCESLAKLGYNILFMQIQTKKALMKPSN